RRICPTDDAQAGLGAGAADRSQRLDRLALLQVKPARAARPEKPPNREEAPMVLLASTSRFFKAADLEHEKKFRIKSVTEKVFGEQKEKKPVVWFTKDERGLALNIINRRTLQGAFGDETDGWVGKIIIIYPTTVDFRGKPTPGLRV